MEIEPNDIEPMKLAEIYNKAMNRSHELVVMSAVWKRLFNQNIHKILSKAARQKFYRKNIKKANRDEVRKEAIKFLLELNEDEGDMAMAKFVCGVVINHIAPRATNDVPEPDVDNFEAAFNGPSFWSEFSGFFTKCFTNDRNECPSTTGLYYSITCTNSTSTRRF